MAGKFIPFGDYLPDIPPETNQGLVVAGNCLPYDGYFASMPSVTAYSTNALSGVCIGFFSTRDNVGVSYSYAGDASALYRLSSAVWADATRASGGAYSTATDDVWEFAKWGNYVIATNYSDVIQSITMGDTAFTALSGSPPKARHMAVVREFLVLGNVTDYSSGAAVPNRVHWSGFDNIGTWTPALATQCDYQDLQGDGGWVQKVVGGEYGIVFQERSIWRMTYVGSPFVFQFDEIEPGMGTPAPNSVIKKGDRIFYLGQDDFFLFYGGASTPIGHNRIYKTFINDFDANYYQKICGMAHPVEPFVFWAYPGAGNTGGVPNKVLAYNWVANKWSGPISITVELLCLFQREGYTLDGLDAVSASLDALVYSLDSREWMGRVLQFAAFTSAHKLGTFSGTHLDATFQTGEKQLLPGRKSLVTNMRPHIEQGNGTLSVSLFTHSRNKPTESLTASTAITMNTDGECPQSIDEARYYRADMSTTGPFTHAYGVEIEYEPGGRY